MAKRFTDTEKWKKPWFRKLSATWKLVWIYICDNCDHAGVWPADFDLLSFQIGESISENSFVEMFEDKVERLEDGKFFIRPFVEFQYGELNPSNNAHRAVLKVLEKLAPHQPLISPSLGAQDKEKDKDKDSSSSESTSVTNLREEISECVNAWGYTLGAFGISKNPNFDAAAIGRMIQTRGFEQTRLALLGASEEKPTDTFRPADHISVTRVEKHFAKFTNLGSRVFAKLTEEQVNA